MEIALSVTQIYFETMSKKMGASQLVEMLIE